MCKIDIHSLIQQRLKSFHKYRFNPHSARSKELLNNFKILTGQGYCASLPYSRACTKTKKRLVITLNQENILLLVTNIFILLDEKINSRAKYF
jgi:hypothetical protein